MRHQFIDGGSSIDAELCYLSVIHVFDVYFVSNSLQRPMIIIYHIICHGDGLLNLVLGTNTNDDHYT
jgi:hypothetical protein